MIGLAPRKKHGKFCEICRGAIDGARLYRDVIHGARSCRGGGLPVHLCRSEPKATRDLSFFITYFDKRKARRSSSESAGRGASA